MSTTTYKGFTIRTVGISRHIYLPGQYDSSRADNLAVTGYAQSTEAAKRWINARIAQNFTEA